jgi:hypothetical protein
MTGANYIRNLKALGKLCFLYDNATAAALAQQTLRATTADQVADGTVTTLPAVDLFAQYDTQWKQGITAGATALQAVAIAFASSYLIDPTFTAGLTTTPTATTPVAVLTAFATEMTSVDNKTLTTLAATGLVNFFDIIMGSAGSWNTAADGSADYKDSVYVVSAVV